MKEIDVENERNEIPFKLQQLKCFTSFQLVCDGMDVRASERKYAYGMNKSIIECF